MDILLNKPGKKIILLGNEAIVRGALESGVQFVAVYPGTPSTEIGDNFNKIVNLSKEKSSGDFYVPDLYFEYSANEKVALETGVGASYSGLKTLVAMKNFGLNVCLDSLLPFVYTGSKGPTVIVVADDPSCHSSAQSEQNTRAVPYMAHIPTLEPADPQECKDFIKLAFQLSEKFQIPVMVRTTTRVAHQKMPVRLGSFSSLKKEAKGIFIKDPKRFVTLPPRVMEMKKELFEKINKIKFFSEKSPINFIEETNSSNNKTGIITSASSYLYVKEALKELDLKLPILKAGFFYPLAEEKIGAFIKKLKKVLIVEEMEPFLEKEVERLAKNANPKLKIFGKNVLPIAGELRPEHVIAAVAKLNNLSYRLPQIQQQNVKHLPRFCPGCPYWLVFGAVKRAVPQDTVFGGDIGCYMLAGLSPHNMQDYLSAMGSSLGIAHGISMATKSKVVAFIGDSTFFHAGIPALLNTVFNKSNPLIIILDNGTTGMTGRQPNPGNSVRNASEYKYEWEGYEPCAATSEQPVKIEDVVRACGVKNLKIVDSFNLASMESAVKEFFSKKEVSVIIARGMCTLMAKSLKNERF